jgi:hypothetical protein
MNPLTEPADHRRCTATANRHGGRCKRAAIAGGNVCPTHGGRAPAVRRRAAQRVALEQARALLGDDRDADPGAVLLASVKAAASLLAGARAAIHADDADDLDLRQLADAAQIAAKLARLCLDAGLAESYVRAAQQQGEVVGALIKRIVGGAGLPREQENRLYVAMAAELRRVDGFDFDGVGEQHDLLKIDADIAILEAKLREHEQVEEAQRLRADMPRRLAQGIAAGFAVLDLDDADQERVATAVEGFLQLDADGADQAAGGRRAEQAEAAERQAAALRTQKWGGKGRGR